MFRLCNVERCNGYILGLAFLFPNLPNIYLNKKKKRRNGVPRNKQLKKGSVTQNKKKRRKKEKFVEIGRKERKMG